MGTPLNVLVVEDSEDDVHLLVRELKQGGYDVKHQQVDRPETMQAALAGHQWDIVISDYSLPQFSGLAALSLLQKSGHDLPFILISGTIGEETAVAAMRAGAHDYLLKGKLARLVPAIQRELRDAETRRERRRAEEALREVEQRLHTIVNNAPMSIFATDNQGVFTLAEGKSLERVGMKPGENVGISALDLYSSLPVIEENGAVTSGEAVVHRVLAGETIRGITSLREVYFDNQFVPLRDSNSHVVGLIGVATDITERKQAEEELRIKELAIATSINAIAFADLDGRLTYVNRSFLGMWGYDHESEVLGRSALEFWQEPEDAAEVMRTLAEQQGRIVELTAKRKDGRIFQVQVAGSLVTDKNGQPLRLMGSFIDITNRKQAEAKVQQQLRRLTILRKIDQAITGSTDLHFVLETILKYVKTELNVDATVILLFSPVEQTLKYEFGMGMQTDALKFTRLRLGDGYAGKAALERHTVFVSGLQNRTTDFLRSPTFSLEGFTSYFGVPLIAKGKIKGVLEIFHRSPLKPEQEWLDFMETLAGQLAIAIDNSILYQDLQRSNLDLTLAYNATIEGWSKALDLRDKETEGHTQRVTQMTIRLARAMGLDEAEILHIQRGGLLHDIGKMGVPDRILLKPDKLTDDEWEIMRQHPAFAYDMLSPIQYLHRALDIPYCHHEKWDGSGYPRGLQGEQIPLAARIFAVVDVWDALTSDRPYRAAWSKQQTLTYIKDQSGKHFDPRVVATFIELIVPLA